MAPSVGDVWRGSRAPGTVLPALILAAILAGAAFPAATAAGERCEDAVHALNRRISPRIDEVELVSILRTLSESRNRRLPERWRRSGPTSG